MRTETEKLLACPCCHAQMIFMGMQSEDRFNSGYFRCGNSHLYQVKEEIGLFKENKFSANEFEWKVNVVDEEGYDEIRKKYDSYFGEEQKVASRKLRDLLESKVVKSCVESDHRVLDVASGMGTFILPLAEKSNSNLQIIGTDIDEKPLRGSMNKAKRLGTYESISLAVMDAKHLAFKDAVLTTISSNFGFDNVPKATFALNESARVLRTGGRAIFSSLWYEEDSKSMRLADQHDLGQLASEARLKMALEEAGFVLDSVDKVYSDVWPHSPMDLLPVEGDRYQHVVIQARKSGTV